MTDLIQRIEAAKEPRRELFEDAFRALHGDYSDIVIWHANRSNPADGATAQRFRAMLDAQAWTSAAEMLLPEGWNWMAGERDPGKCRAYVENNQPAFVGFGNKRNPDRVWHEVVAAHPSLALLSAIMRAERKDDE